jgi:murein DD-endopeptidase MepM/ murein hydrolase activator NlpD
MRRTFPLTLLALAGAAALPSPASAAVAHTVAPGETLWTIAAASNLTTRTLAAFNGLSEDSHVILGSTIQIPSIAEGTAALQRAGVTPRHGRRGAPARRRLHRQARRHLLVAGRPRRRDRRAGRQRQRAEPDGPLLAGTAIKLPPASVAAPQAAKPAAQAVVPKAAPAPSGTRVDANTIHSVAGQHGVPGSLAAAIGWQESGFNNAMVSSANARGVMQVMPGTWDWVQDNLASRRLDPSSAVDNVHAGTLYLRQLLKESGGDPAIARPATTRAPRACARSGCSPRPASTSTTCSRCARASEADESPGPSRGSPGCGGVGRHHSPTPDPTSEPLMFRTKIPTALAVLGLALSAAPATAQIDGLPLPGDEVAKVAEGQIEHTVTTVKVEGSKAVPSHRRIERWLSRNRARQIVTTRRPARSSPSPRRPRPRPATTTPPSAA